MSMFGRVNIIQAIALVVLVVLEGLATLSAALNLVFLPLGPFYPNVASLLILLLPVAIGALSWRWEIAIVGAALPFLVLAVVYTTIYAPAWNIDLFQLGVLAERVAGAEVLFGGLGGLGYLMRRIFRREAGENPAG